MELLNNNFEEIKRVNDPDIINDFLIKLSKDPNKDYLIYINYLLNNLEAQILNKVKLNIIFLIGEIGGLTNLNDRFLIFLIETYYISDRWIRNEIIQAIEKISTNSDITEKVIELVGNAVNDDYSPIRVNALRVILNLKEFPSGLRRNIFQTLNLKDSELERYCIQILDKFLPDFNQLTNSLNNSDNYKILKPYTIRILLLVYFRSPLNLESFRQKISNSNWENEYKEIYLKEIGTYERILLKRL